jgi:hypothetical protein
MEEQKNTQQTNNQNDASNQQVDPNASVSADMLGTEHPSGQGVNVGSGYISGQPSEVPESIADAEASGEEFIPTGTGDPAAGVIVEPNQSQIQQLVAENQNTNTSSSNS